VVKMREGGPIRVLLADDEAAFRQTTARLLERHGLCCEQVSSGQAAIDYLADQPVDVLVADIKMPGNDQLELVSYLRRLDAPPGVILVTGYPSVDTAVGSMERGVSAYLVKPFELEDFLAQVMDAGSRTRFLRRLRRQRHELDLQAERLEALRSALSGPGAADLNQTAADYLSMLMLSLADTALEASSLLTCLNAGKQPVRGLSRHPELDAYQAAVLECIAVLEKTKTSFKSKELALLRKQLLALVEVTRKA
jgi:DNA-binding response OmpR family regulator